MRRWDDHRSENVTKLAERVLKTRFGYTLADLDLDPPEVTKLAASLIVEEATRETETDLKDFDPAAVALHAARIIVKLNARIAELETELRKLKTLTSSSS